MKFLLLSRNEFRYQVFARDSYKCVVCKESATEVHHIIERRLWGKEQEGGYFLANGVSVCSDCHLKAERTEISCDKLRELAGIKEFPLPDHLYHDQPYDKWGNPILPNGMRLKGELFEEEPVQKMLAPMLALFTDRIKAPRTFHLPWSPGLRDDDKVLKDLSHLEKEEVIVSIKQDGENTTLYPDYLHARSIEYDPHPSRSWVKSLHAKIAHEIPKGWRIGGENLFARHSIHYQNLDDYFQVFAVWNSKNICQSWNETKEWAELLGLKTVPVIYEGAWDEKKIKGLYTETFNGDPCEGYVVRVRREFHYREFRDVVGKFVRAGHVSKDNDHWMHQKVIPNKLKEC
jgi:hypothetical protein